jgi:hypothetical protein
MVSLLYLGALADTAQRNGTEHAFVPVAMQWAKAANDEIVRLRAELDLRRKSGSASERLHNLCEGIAKDADGSEWSREEWERLDAENASLRAELAAAKVDAEYLRAIIERYRISHDALRDWAQECRDKVLITVAQDSTDLGRIADGLGQSSVELFDDADLYSAVKGKPHE